MYLVNLLLANMPNMLASGWGASNSDRTAALSAANPGAILPKGPFAALLDVYKRQLSVTRLASCQNIPYTDKNAGSIGRRYAVRRSAPSRCV